MNRSQWCSTLGLCAAQSLIATGQVTVATLAAIIGALLSPTAELATLPVAAAVVGVALATLPAATLIRRFGRRPVFALSSLWGAAGVSLAAFSIQSGSFLGFCIGCFLMGNNMAVVAQYRFALADIVPPSFVSRAVSILMIGTLLAVLVTPWLVLHYRYLLPVDYAGSFAILPIPFIAAALIVLFTPLGGKPTEIQRSITAVSLGQILSRPSVQLAMIAGAVGYGVMSLIMTAAPVSMHVMDHHSVEATADVIRGHLLAMFAPSLVSGWLITKVGLSRMLWVGLLFEAGCVGLALSGQEVWHYRFALIALGVGWNLLFVGGTTLLARACHGDELVRIQGINDFVMFATMAVASLSAGALLNAAGWFWTNAIAIFLLALVVVALVRDSGKRGQRSA